MEPTGPVHDADEKDRQSAILIYILYLVGFATGVSALAGVVLAHVKETTNPVWQSHFDFQIRTFWLGLAMLVVGGVLSLVLVGWIVIAWWALWTLIRVVKGIVLASDRKPVEAPETMMW